MTNSNHEKIVILDFGGQYTHLIARRVRECGVYSSIEHPENFKPDETTAGIIFSGSPKSVTDESMTAVAFDINEINVPLLGICYGHQLIARLAGGTVESHLFREYGSTDLEITETAQLFNGMDKNQRVWMSHGDSVSQMPDDYIVTASSSTTPVCAFRHKTKNIFGVQFHPEVSHTLNGQQIISNFVNLCNEKKNWHVESFSESLINQIREQSTGKKLLLFVSGGVDSLVALALCAKAVGAERLIALHIDNGLMRYKESESVMKFLNELGLANALIVDASEKFLSRLKGIIEPEQKRKIIGAAFVEVMNEFLAEHGHEAKDWLLVQGTIYPDTIESGGTQFSGAIKTHHNRVPEIEQMIADGRVIEPLKELYKDEVRKLGYLLKLPPALVDRRPFPGPGLAIRVLATNQNEPAYNPIELPEDLFDSNEYKAAILNIKSVGVQGDDRTYKHPMLLWNRTGFETDWQTVKSIARSAINQIPDINRVIWSPMPIPDILTIRPLSVTNQPLELLRIVDHIVQQKTAEISDIWQLPVVVLPLFDDAGNQCFVLRPIVSADAMTADVYEMQSDLLLNIISSLREIAGVGYIFYDITTKPPATIEWE